MTNRLLPVVAVAATMIAFSDANATTLDEVKERGILNCGVNTDLPGFSVADEGGNWSGFDVDYCRAVAAAIFGEADAVKFVPLDAAGRFDALKSGEIDMLARNTTWTMTRDTSLGLTFAGISYFDGQGFMARKSLGIASALELSGATVCVREQIGRAHV